MRRCFYRLQIPPRGGARTFPARNVRCLKTFGAVGRWDLSPTDGATIDLESGRWWEDLPADTGFGGQEVRAGRLSGQLDVAGLRRAVAAALRAERAEWRLLRHL